MKKEKKSATWVNIRQDDLAAMCDVLATCWEYFDFISKSGFDKQLEIQKRLLLQKRLQGWKGGPNEL